MQLSLHTFKKKYIKRNYYVNLDHIEEKYSTFVIGSITGNQ